MTKVIFKITAHAPGYDFTTKKIVELSPITLLHKRQMVSTTIEILIQFIVSYCTNKIVLVSLSSKSIDCLFAKYRNASFPATSK
jgi:hypothetical protein